MTNTYDKGDLVRVFGTFASTAGAALDPTSVKFRYQPPGSTTVTLVYNTSTRVVKSAVGSYYVDVQADTRGVWRYRWQSSGAGRAAHESQFTVKPGLI